MLSKRRKEATELCVLRVSIDVLNLDGVVLADSNASSKYVRFLAPSQWRVLAFEDIFALNWKHPDDQIAEWRHSAHKCAEVLVPHRVGPEYLLGAYRVDKTSEERLRALGFGLSIVVDSALFFH